MLTGWVRWVVLLAALAAVAGAVTGVVVVVKNYNEGRAAVAARSAFCATHEIRSCSDKSITAYVQAKLDHIGDLTDANAKTVTSARSLAAQLLHALAQNERVRIGGDLAIAAARAARADAERTLAEFTKRFAERKPTCDVALRAMQTACPELEGY